MYCYFSKFPRLSANPDFYLSNGTAFFRSCSTSTASALASAAMVWKPASYRARARCAVKREILKNNQKRVQLAGFLFQTIFLDIFVPFQSLVQVRVRLY